jgi:hypothetical protein
MTEFQADDYEALFSTELAATLSEYCAAAVEDFRGRMRRAGFAYQPGEIRIQAPIVESVEAVPKEIREVIRAAETLAYGMSTESPAGCVIGTITERQGPVSSIDLRHALSEHGFVMTDNAVYTLLSRMTAAKVLTRVRRGLYDLGERPEDRDAGA